MATSNRMRRLNLLTLILLNKATREKGLTIQEIIDETQGDLSRTTLGRLLKEPGFMVANYPTWPKGYYFDPTEAVMGIPSTQDRIIKNQAQNYASSVAPVESRFKNLPGKYQRDNALGKYEDKPTAILAGGTSAKEMAAGIAYLPEAVAKKILAQGNPVQDLRDKVKAFKENGTKLDPADCREDGERIINLRNAAFVLFELCDIMLADPILNTPEWWSVFDTEEGNK